MMPQMSPQAKPLPWISPTAGHAYCRAFVGYICICYVLYGSTTSLLKMNS
jgi:hypothetical protein